jgi:8-amino-7-oxononanoate synthase
MTEPEPLQQVDRTFVRWKNRTLSYFSGCDYFRLASHPAVLDAASDGLRKYGLNVAASRMTTGNHRLYRLLEVQVRGFFGAEDALIVPGGYMTSLVTAQALAGHFSHALVDERAHPALLDAAQLLNCPVLTFKHLDTAELERTLHRCGTGSRPVLLTDGLFASSGLSAPLAAYLRLLPKDGLIIVDDAHGAGVLGSTGKGAVEGVSRKRIVQCITFSKAFGTYGGAVLGSRALRKNIMARSRLFIGSTPLPLPLANATLQAVAILKKDRQLRVRLAANTARVKSALAKNGFAFPEMSSPIVPIECRTQRDIAALQRRLLASGIYPPFIKYPGGPANGYFRFVISSEHTIEQLDGLVGAVIR